MSIKGAFLVSFARSGGVFLLQFISNIVLARLLLPSEIGVFSVAVATTTILHALRDFGVGRFLLKEPDLTDDKVRTVFGVALLTGWSIAALIFLSSGAVASYYDEPRIESLLALLSINFLMLPFGQPALALMRRERRFARLALITLATVFTGAGVSILSAALGAGAFSLAYGALANNGLMVVLSLLSRPDHVLLRPSLKEWRCVCGFGGLASITIIIVQIGGQMPELVLGRFLGFAAVGYYSRGFGLATIVDRFFVSAMSWVTGAEFSARRRSDTPLTSLVLKTTDYTVTIGWPALLFLAVKAEAVIWILLGANWLPAVPVVQALCVARAIQLTCAQAAAVYEGTGAIKLQFRNEVVIQTISVVLLFIGVQHSLEMVAWLRVPSALLAVVIHFTVFRRYADVGFRKMLAVLWRPGLIVAGLAATLAGMVALEPAGLSHAPVLFFAEAGAFSLAYLLLLLATRHPLHNDLWTVGKGMALKLVG